MTALSIAPDLLEEAVLLAERQAAPSLARAFRRERDRIYEVPDPEEREKQFEAQALAWFDRFGLRRRLDVAASGWEPVADRVAGARVVRATGRSGEGADLIDVAPSSRRATSRPLLVLRVTPQSLLDDDALSSLLRHELMHLTDMLDPAFGYQRILPHTDGGPSADNLFRERYRVLWDTTIDGRIDRAGRGHPRTRERRWREFATTFARLGDQCPGQFEQWWNERCPTHARLVAFAAPAGDAGRCPLCLFPAASLDRRVAAMTARVERAVRAEHPAWRPAQGICPQCFDLYEARHGQPDLARSELA
jgi:hypothetical protein